MALRASPGGDQTAAARLAAAVPALNKRGDVIEACGCLLRCMSRTPAALATLSKQRSPTPQHEAEDPEERRHHVDGDEHAKHQSVVDERRGVLINRDRRDRSMRVLHEIE